MLSGNLVLDCTEEYQHFWPCSMVSDWIFGLQFPAEEHPAFKLHPACWCEMPAPCSIFGYLSRNCALSAGRKLQGSGGHKVHHCPPGSVVSQSSGHGNSQVIVDGGDYTCSDNVVSQSGNSQVISDDAGNTVVQNGTILRWPAHLKLRRVGS